jgi:ribosome-associated toxin RatA of RatAB toxin-antitoxin module
VRKGLAFGAAFALFLSFAPQASSPALASSSGKAEAKAAIHIKAPPRVVWKAVHAERHVNPEVAYSKVLTESGNIKTIEQKFVNIPILGSVVAVTKQTEEPHKRIDYELLKSDKFKALEGSWTLTPHNGGNETMLELRSHLDVGVPFSGMFIKNATQKKLQKRIANVKQIAEKEQARIAGGAQTE